MKKVNPAIWVVLGLLLVLVLFGIIGALLYKAPYASGPVESTAAQTIQIVKITHPGLI